jgi:predicted RNA binding protein YcfA (HicA-like mRNA interferase family)
MTKLPQVKPRDLAKALIRLGFNSRQGKGSHVIFFDDAGRHVSIPMHRKPLGRGLLHKVLKQLDISREQLKEVL